MTKAKMLNQSAVVQHSNRCLLVTGKWKNTTQQCSVRCNVDDLKSVCRERPGAALAASATRVYRLRVNRCVQAYEQEVGPAL
jgi:hypothetical protein